MKTNSKTIAVMMLVLFMASCNNKDSRMLTVINEDGPYRQALGTYMVGHR